MKASGSPMGRWGVRKFVWVLVALLIPGSLARAEPPTPETVWTMTGEAELVVWADVEEVRPLSKADLEQMGPKGWEPVWGRDMLTRLRIREVWKGEGEVRQGAQLLVHWEESACPPPPHYKVGHAVVAFLSHETEKWETVAWSYGTRYPTGDDEVAAYRQAVALAKDAQHIRSQARSVGNRLDLEPMRVDWQVKVAAHPATRWDGMYGLAGWSDVVYAFNDWRGPSPMRLSDAQRAQLARGFVANPPLDSALPSMLMVLRGHPDKQVDLVAARALETVFISRRVEEWVVHAFDLLRERHGEKAKPRKRLSDEEAYSLRVARDTANDGSTSRTKWERDILGEWMHFKQRHRLMPTPLPLPVARRSGDSPF
ncbi:hypothetical protein MYSTI_06433 [Myxococcus stipitatus DSM 14675]|uniref:Uncharacterized protein n=1 Tax=Myxococcus stipitatus (strain DSM 14675 / JCM 12634 / Mx s8) TaxID=1278073 RepID=L7UFI5_MYXSD|nr:hypothetical protein [Myxococcus stipitatus]AGC47706.1 hypothetical protein MYSTI_06433 [Myxococcus stipitatus DSM 14675]